LSTKNSAGIVGIPQQVTGGACWCYARVYASTLGHLP
jgi:hypothetical protein